MALKSPLKLVDQTQPFATRGAQNAAQTAKQHADAINAITVGGTIPATRRALLSLTVVVGATLESPYPITLARPPGWARISGLLLVDAMNVTTGATSYSLGVPHSTPGVGGSRTIKYIPGLETNTSWLVTLEAIGS